MPAARPAETSTAVGIVGCGHVGTALAQALQAHLRVLCCDPALKGASSLAQLAATCGLIFVCVPTPGLADGTADTSMVDTVVADLADLMGGQAGDLSPLVVIKSTVPPGTTQRLATQYRHLPLVTSPEFMREQAGVADLVAANRFLVGLPVPAPRPELLARLHAVLYAIAPGATVITTPAATAELVKYATNAFLAMKVVFAHQMADACAELDLNYPEFASALALDPRIGPSHLAAPNADGGRGFAGSCLPKDLAALLAIHGPQLALLQVVAACNDLLRQRGAENR